MPAEKNLPQPMRTEAQYRTIRKVAGSVSPRFEVALVLCAETGHRLNSVRQLRWTDVDLDGPSVW